MTVFLSQKEVLGSRTSSRFSSSHNDRPQIEQSDMNCICARIAFLRGYFYSSAKFEIEGGVRNAKTKGKSQY